MKQLVIVCGGRGSRLSINYPKILVKIKSKTILEHLIELAKFHGFEKIILLSGYKSHSIKFFIKKKKLFKKIKIIKDKKKLGNGGALLNSIKYLDDEFCLIYGDILTNIDLTKMYKFFKIKKSNLTIVVNKNNNFKDSNLLIFDKKKVVKKLYFYPHKKIPKNSYSNEAIFMCKKKIFSFIDKKFFKQKTDFFKNLIPEILKFSKSHAFKSNHFIIDCGTLKRVKIANSKFKSLAKKNV